MNALILEAGSGILSLLARLSLIIDVGGGVREKESLNSPSDQHLVLRKGSVIVLENSKRGKLPSMY